MTQCRFTPLHLTESGEVLVLLSFQAPPIQRHVHVGTDSPGLYPLTKKSFRGMLALDASSVA